MHIHLSAPEALEVHDTAAIAAEAAAHIRRGRKLAEVTRWVGYREVAQRNFNLIDEKCTGLVPALRTVAVVALKVNWKRLAGCFCPHAGARPGIQRCGGRAYIWWPRLWSRKGNGVANGFAEAVTVDWFVRL